MSYKTRNEWIEDAKNRLLKNERRADEAARELLFLSDEAAYSIEKEINKDFGRLCMVEIEIEHLTGKQAIDYVRKN